jgi:hypothetical protein
MKGGNMEFEQTVFMDIIKEVTYNPWDYEDRFHEEDYLALEYQRTTNDKRRGEIAQYFVNRFLNLVKGQLGGFVAKQGNIDRAYKEYLKEEGLAYWNFIVCQKLNEFGSKKGKKHDFVNILALLAPWAREGVTSYLNDSVVWKDSRYSTVDDDTADSLNGYVLDSDTFKAYEAHLMTRAFAPKEERELQDIIDNIDIDSACREIGGLYDPRNEFQWDAMSNGLKIYNEQKKKEEKMTEEERMSQKCGFIDRGRNGL